ncbi:hypothetical protein L1987_67989 [Smallanthus sonchifolius]|uniref:Uncharacterized protein n=1 Tax=Smallanthus sonchifolius TaxID=185202 RepID=A0ACB9B406_9ASTR|nr:hypothetical protein L1987_67989 [Smallanthus sonchifolius]
MARSSLIPGFRFHPTDVELVMYYLKKKLMGKKIIIDVVAEVNIYEFCPWDLPDKSSLKSGDLEWYFFCPKSKKYSSGDRANRATETGFWKATGKDRKVEYKGSPVATIKTLIFHLGHAGKGKGDRTNWVMHEYRMDDKQLANAGIVQDTYVLCRIFEKSGSGPKNGEQYGAPFNEEEWDDDVASCSDSQALVALVGASNIKDHKQKGPATSSMTGPGSSMVTFSADEPTKTLNYKQKGPATRNIDEPGSTVATFSANEPPTNTLNYKQKGPATKSMTEPGSSTVTFSADELSNTLTYKQKGPATMDMTEPGSSMVMFSANEPTMNMTVPQITHGLSVTEPGSSNVTLSTNEMPVNDDVITLEDMYQMVKEDANGEKVEIMAPNEYDSIYADLMNFDDPDGWKHGDDPDLGNFVPDGLDYMFDEFQTPVDPDLRNFVID